MAASLAHVLVVAGTQQEWAQLDSARWRALADELGSAAASARCPWLTLRVYEAGAPSDATERAHLVVADGRCTVIIDPVADGRQRFADAMTHVPAVAPIDEKTVAVALYEPADVEPDLVLVLGPSTRLPPSLVWELAYGELVFLPIGFADLRGEHLLAAIEEYHGRRRRFGGLDS